MEQQYQLSIQPESTFDSDQVACVCEVLHQSGDIDRLV
uniref:BMA-CEH-33, isoform b n=1 Tax=Brugia malayi TaxID=6279 RepID=A0A1I9GBE3_BRUMA|nr:BMA-CEH-33, isoform b [Brugia malayi]